MEINVPKKETITLEDIKDGSLFWFSGHLYLKPIITLIGEELVDKDSLAIDLETNTMAYFGKYPCNSIVTPENRKMKISPA